MITPNAEATDQLNSSKSIKEPLERITAKRAKIRGSRDRNLIGVCFKLVSQTAQHSINHKKILIQRIDITTEVNSLIFAIKNFGIN